MDIKIGKDMYPGFGTVLNEQGDILGIVQYAPGQHITDVISRMISERYSEFKMISFDKTIINNLTDFTSIEGVMITQDDDEVRFELSFTPTTLYKVAA